MLGFNREEVWKQQKPNFYAILKIRFWKADRQLFGAGHWMV